MPKAAVAQGTGHFSRLDVCVVALANRKYKLVVCVYGNSVEEPALFLMFTKKMHINVFYFQRKILRIFYILATDNN